MLTHKNIKSFEKTRKSIEVKDNRSINIKLINFLKGLQFFGKMEMIFLD